MHRVKSVHIQGYSGPHFPTFRLNTERYVSVRIQSECGKMRTRQTPNTDTIYAVMASIKRNGFNQKAWLTLKGMGSSERNGFH